LAISLKIQPTIKCIQNYGPEIFNSAKEKWMLFVAASGTGGTLAGVSKFLKEKIGNPHSFVDPMGSGMYSHFKLADCQ